ncbi:hypothetical protein CLU79DRAFT_776060 [Phycomyces nitens]|nr:hypothetical protein CLU79DRAFT_776060 [Phycomyces nitens]
MPIPTPCYSVSFSSPYTTMSTLNVMISEFKRASHTWVIVVIWNTLTFDGKRNRKDFDMLVSVVAIKIRRTEELLYGLCRCVV